MNDNLLKKRQKIMLKNNIEKYLDQIVAIGPRAPGSWGELEAAKLVKELLDEMGFNTEIETFESPSHLAETSCLKSSGGKMYPSLPSMFSPAGDIEGELIFLGNCQTGMLGENSDLSGKIGIVNPSGTFQERITHFLSLEQRGLEGLIVISPDMDVINSKIIRYPEIKRLPSVVVSYRTACALQLLEGELFSLLVKHCSTSRNESVNTVAEIEGETDNWMVVVAHLDTASFTVGANDNASGCALLLELASQMIKGSKPKNNICFLFSGSEEYGGLDGCGVGAEAFFQKRQNHLDKCIGLVAVDDVGNGLWPLELLVGGNNSFKEAIEKVDAGLPYRIIEDFKPACDHGAAVKRGIPYIWFTNALFTRATYHTPADTMEFLDINAIADIFPFVKKIVETFSCQTPFFPTVTDGDRIIRQARFMDIPIIQDITRLAFEPVSLDRMGKDFFGENLGGKEWHEYKNASMKDQCQGNIYQVIVCEVNEKTVGYATMSLDFQRGIAEIGNNAVHPDFQGKGIGKAMQKEIMRRMQESGFEKFKVSTLSNDIAAQKVYEKLGFIKIIEGYHYLKN
jgi:RimJ/RimL family protein N-acetyltransferase